MCRSSFKYNLTFIILFFGITLVHAGTEGEETSTSENGITLFYTDWSVPCRAVLMLGKMLNVPFNFVKKDLEKHDQYDPEYEKINPLRKVPAIIDNEYHLWESRAILVYLAQKFGPRNNKILFPDNVKEQAVVNKMLHFDMGTLSPAFNNLYGMWAFYNAPKTEFKQTQLLDALQIFDNILEKQSYSYAAGSSITVADISLFANIITIEAAGQDLTIYKNISAWYTKCKEEITNYADVNKAGLDILQKKKELREKEEEEKGVVDGSVSNHDVFTALSTLLSGVRSQVLSTKHIGYFKSLMDNVTPLVKT